MHSVTMPKKKTRGCKFIFKPIDRTNILPINVQIQLQARSQRNDKSRTRNKGKSWRKEQGV